MTHSMIVWQDPAWLAEVERWALSELQPRGFQATGPVEQVHLRPWSTILRLPGKSEDYFVKAVNQRLVHEARLTLALSGWIPPLLPGLVAVDTERGWILMADAGTRLREQLIKDLDLGYWERLLPQYAQAQITLADHQAELLAMGVPDRRLERLPGLYDQLLQDPWARQEGMPHGLAPEIIQELEELKPTFAQACRDLAGYGIPDSINHGDFHDGNVFVSDGGYHIVDWGDSSVSHPFFSMRTACVSIEVRFDWEDDDPRCEPLRARYLQPWTRFLPPEQLQEAFRLSKKIAPCASALGWQRALQNVEEAEREQWAYGIPSLLQEMLDYFSLDGSTKK